MRTERVEWFSNRDPFRPEISELLDIGVFLPLENKDPSGCQVFIVRTGAHDTKRHNQNDMLKVISSTAFVRIEHFSFECTLISGLQNDFGFGASFR